MMFCKNRKKIELELKIATFNFNNPPKFKVGDHVLNSKIVGSYCTFEKDEPLPYIHRVYLLSSEKDNDIFLAKFSEYQLCMLTQKKFNTKDFYNLIKRQ